MRRTVLPAICGLGFLPTLASAHLCRGFPAVSGNTTGHAGVVASFAEGAKGYGAPATFGGSAWR